MKGQIVDQWGNPVSTRDLKRRQTKEVRSAMVYRDDAFHPAAGLTPQGLAALLIASIEGDPEPYLALAEDMEEREPHYASVLGTRKRQVSSLEVTVHHRFDDARSLDHKELIEEIVGGDTFADTLFDVLDAVGKGFSHTEIDWDTSERQWRPLGFDRVDPRQFSFDAATKRIPHLRTTEGPQRLKPFQWICHCAKFKSGLPIRGGIARAAAWTFLFKAFTAKDWAVFCEAYGQPFRLGKYHSGATDADKATLMDAVARIGTDYAAIIPEGMTLELVEASITGNHELFERRSAFLDQQVSKLVLGQTGTTDAIAGGHAVGRVHDEVKQDIEDADARQLAATLNRDLVRPLIDLNFGPQKHYPTLSIGRAEQIDLDKLVKNVSTLVDHGLPVSQKTMLDHLGLPEPDEDDILLVPSGHRATGTERDAPPVPADDIPGDPVTDPKTASGRLPRPGSDAIDQLIDELMMADGWEAMVSPVIDGLAEEIAAAASLEEVRLSFLRRLETMGVTALADRLAQAAFAARLAGEAGEELT